MNIGQSIFEFYIILLLNLDRYIIIIPHGNEPGQRAAARKGIAARTQENKISRRRH